MTKTIEYRVRPVTRYIVTRFWSENGGDLNGAGSSQHGEFDNADTAYQVGYALCAAEHERLGWPLSDERIRYPSHPAEATAKLVEGSLNPRERT
jgi:hypothetical protein